MLSPDYVHSRAGTYVTFKIARRYFAIEAARVRNVMPASAIAALPQAIEGLHGIVRVSGRVTPVLDVRERLGLQPRPPGPRTSVMLVALDQPPTAWLGLIVDKLTEVLELHDRDIRGNIVQLRAGGRPYGRPKLLLDVATLTTPEELTRWRSELEGVG